VNSARDQEFSLWSTGAALLIGAASHEIALRQTQAYLAPGLGPARPLAIATFVLFSAFGAALGRACLLRASLRGAWIATSLSVLSLCCALSGVAWFFAFEHGWPFGAVALSVPAICGLLSGAALSVLVSGCAPAYRELAPISFWLRPTVMAALLALGFGAALALSHLGLLRAAAALGVGLGTAALLTARFALHLADPAPSSTLLPGCALAGSLAVLALAQALVPARILAAYPAEIVWSRDGAPPLVVVSAPFAFELYEDEQLRVTSLDAQRLAESVVHPVLGLSGSRRRVLVLGPVGAHLEREILRYPDVELLVSVNPSPPGDWQGTLFPASPAREALRDRRLRHVENEPLAYLEARSDTYDRIVMALGQPQNYVSGKYYTRYFFELLRERLEPAGALLVSIGSALALPETVATLRATLAAAGFKTRSYEAPVPLLGGVACIAASAESEPKLSAAVLPRGLDFMSPATLGRSLAVPMQSARGSISTLDDQTAVHSFHREIAEVP
jgi:spermidine synthase